jgi:hypothetical protein
MSRPHDGLTRRCHDDGDTGRVIGERCGRMVGGKKLSRLFGGRRRVMLKVWSMMQIMKCRRASSGGVKIAHRTLVEGLAG